MENNSCVAPQYMVAKVLPPVMIVEFLLGLPGNVMALWIFCFRLQGWRTTTIYLLNLMLADFLLLAGLPFRIDNHMRGENWIFGEAMCRINLFMLAVNRSASISFMTIVALDRYFKVVHPHHTVSLMSARQAVTVVAVVWPVVFLLRSPLLFNKLLWKEGNNTLCRSFSSKENLTVGLKIHYVLYMAEFFVPFFVLVFCAVRIIYTLRRAGKGRRMNIHRAVRAVLIIVVVFTVCFLPGVATGLATLLVGKLHPEDCKSYLLAGEIFVLTLGFTYLNSALDPLIYCISSSMFREALKKSVPAVSVFSIRERRNDSIASNG
ncbi:hypothetical protein JZ751_008031 [Albula glossodonta]|uniref:G-protein coupled receptors family 1 profile domain-containing protein n=1 Tax=Albula glossodonta TaxID=121402 RepID=A0A8T2PBY0_9TELE|nr:hypothetical protein JZ751_008031 [Albula glossodonta]